ncbi:hypothetical protein [Burkholderia territorii]|uniref:hypothetical protein n=1 Tax=Burkholderia territorii TaxID=1503055 RepID=UPI000A570128|nr:hypothetical protein [Burkholderia territorii]
MTRIAPRFAAIAQHVTIPSKDSRPQPIHSTGQFATLYRGTHFAHGTPSAQQYTALTGHTKKMVKQLARDRRGTATVSDSENTAGDEQHEFDVLVKERESNAGHGGGHGNEREDPNEAKHTVAFTSGRRQPTTGSTAPGVLAMQSPTGLGHEADLYLLRDACTRELLALQRELATRPDTGSAARVHAWTARWLSVQQAGLSLPEADLDALRAHTSPRPATTEVATRLPDATRHFNLLVGLLLRQFDRHRSPRQCAFALDTLRALRPE